MNSTSDDDFGFVNDERARFFVGENPFNMLLSFLSAIDSFSNGDELYFSFFFSVIQNLVMKIHLWVINIFELKFLN